MIDFPDKQVGAEKALGYNLHRSMLATCLSPKDALTVAALERNAEQNRDPLDVILLIAYQLGYSNALARLPNDPVRQTT